MPNHAPFLGVFGGFEPLNIVGGHSKGTSLGDDASFKPQMVKFRPGVRLGRSCEKKSITRTGQDRTTKKSQKRNISHIWLKAPRKDIAMKFGTAVHVLEVVTWAEFDL